MATYKAPKQWKLGKIETLNSFENWKQNQMFNLSLCPNFARFLGDDVTWQKTRSGTAHRGFTNDGAPIEQADRLSAQQKVNYVNIMLEQIACYCPVISRNSIKDDSTSISSVWQMIRAHYGFQQSGAHFLDFSEIHYEADERPEDLYQRILTFVDDNLLKARGSITHHGDQIEADEQKSPSLENFIVLQWLTLIHKGLPKLVKQKYATELRTRTLASIKCEISQALSSLMEELQSMQDVKNMRTTVNRIPHAAVHRSSKGTPSGGKVPKKKRCELCFLAGRKHDHFLSKCRYLPEDDKRYISSRARNVDIDDQSDTNDSESEQSDTPSVGQVKTLAVNKVDVIPSPFLDAFHKSDPVRITIDGGAIGDFMSLTEARRLGVTIKKTNMKANQADGCSPLEVVGEVHLNFRRDNHVLKFNGLVVKKLDEGILGGTPFQLNNDIGTRVKQNLVTVGDDKYFYDHSPNKQESHTFLVRNISSVTLWPDEDIKLSIPDHLPDDEYYVEPRHDTSTDEWFSPQITRSVGGKISIKNNSDFPINIPKNKHMCQLQAVCKSDITVNTDINKSHPVCRNTPRIINLDFSEQIKLDPQNVMNNDMLCKFKTLHNKFNHVFDTVLPGYNGACGINEAVVNMGPVLPPQRKGRLPLYKKDNLDLLQSKFDELEALNIIATPESVGVKVEYLNPSFLVKKPRGGHRLVTSFGDVGRYAKPQPSLMPNIDNTLYEIGQWKHIICTDLSKAFFQIPLSHESRKFCGIVTPFKGVRVYCRAAMGMPGSETALEELMCKVVGEFIQKGIAAKIADNLYVGGNTVEELFNNWECILSSLSACDLKLSPGQTTVNPQHVTILGWIWSNGTLCASKHRITALSTCVMPETVRQMRGFLGAYKILARVIPRCSQYLSPLEAMASNKQSHDKLLWNDSLVNEFRKAQKALSTNKVIKIPNRASQLWIVPDGAVRTPGIASTLYITRDTAGQAKPEVAGFFSAKLKPNQSRWLPCEIEGLGIAAAVKHWAPYIIQSEHRPCVLTDNKPCIQAHEKLCRGEFSASPRVSTFLSAVTRYHVSVRHIAGINNSLSDFGSRNTTDCDAPNCQICVFINEISDSVVRSVSVEDLMTGRAKVPYLSRNAWHNAQQECPALRRAHAHLKAGTRPSKKVTDAKDVKRYINVATIARDGLMVVKSKSAYSSGERIVIPRSAISGLLTALHIKLNCPKINQLKAICQRYFYALDLDKHIADNVNSCHLCASLKKIPHTLLEQSSSDPPEVIGASFSADIINREKQCILTVREYITSFVTAMIVKDETHISLRDGLIQLAVPLIPLGGPPAVIRCDPAPGFLRLEDDPILTKHNISIETGRRKNVNKNPIAERAIQELEEEICKIEPGGGPINPTILAIATTNLNAKLRSRGVSSREMLYQRDQFTHNQIPISDLELILKQQETKQQNQPSSSLSKNPQKYLPSQEVINLGDVVYLYRDRDKHKARDRYLVVSIDNEWCNIRKFVGNTLRQFSYRVKCNECYKVPVAIQSPCSFTAADSDEESEIDISECKPNHNTTNEPPVLPEIPEDISGEYSTVTLPIPNNNNAKDNSNNLSNNSNTEITPTRTSSRTKTRTKFFQGAVCSLCLNNPCTCIT